MPMKEDFQKEGKYGEVLRRIIYILILMCVKIEMKISVSELEMRVLSLLVAFGHHHFCTL